MTPLLSPDNPVNRRILVVDDNPSIHQDFRKILVRSQPASLDLDAEAAALFGDLAPARQDDGFTVDVAHQGQEALEMIRRARAEQRPYALAFVDMRMPPGWDGLTTITHAWEADPELQTVICTAYSDRSWEEIQSTLSTRDRWLVVKKPFDTIEVLQLAHALTEKWTLARLASLKLESLEQLVQKRTAELQQAHRVQSEFLANASHELLTPLNAVSGFLDLLNTTPLDDEQHDYLREAKAGGKRLHSLLLKILDFNRADAGTLAVTRGEFTPRDLLQAAATDGESAAAKKGLELRTVASPLASQPWQGPKEIVHSVLGLLLDNAIKFTPRGSVTLRADTCADGLQFSVQDTGVGLSPQQLEWIQIPFAQVDGSTNRRSTGLGLGLPLAQRLVRAMGGELRLEAAPDHGLLATFTVKASAAAAPSAFSSAPGRTTSTVLSLG
jgi:signal transduction histidine kinase